VQASVSGRGEFPEIRRLVTREALWTWIQIMILYLWLTTRAVGPLPGCDALQLGGVGSLSYVGADCQGSGTCSPVMVQQKCLGAAAKTISRANLSVSSEWVFETPLPRKVPGNSLLWRIG
jgi:hypothetical protein